MRILVLAACLVLGALQPAVARASGDADDFVNQFHSLCPRDARTEADIQGAFATAGANKTKASLAAFEVAHAAPSDFPASATLAKATQHWVYNKAGWMGLATVRAVSDGDAKELHCKVQMNSADGLSFVWMLQYASGAAPKVHAFDDGAYAYLFPDAKTPNAYYVFWRELPTSIPNAKPTMIVEYVVREGAPLPVQVETPEEQAISRLERFCLDRTPSAVAAKVASGGLGTSDAPQLERLAQPRPDYRREPGQSHAWIMHDADEWRLQVSQAQHASLGPVRECGLRLAGLREQALTDRLASDQRWALEEDAPYNGGRARRYRIGGDQILIYFTRTEPDGPLRDHTLSVVKGGPLVIHPVRR